MMADTHEVGFNCSIGDETAKALCLVIADVGPTWFPRSVVHVDRLSRPAQGCGHRVYLPRELAMQRRELVHVLARDVCGPPKFPLEDFATCRRTEVDARGGSGEVAAFLYVERRMAHLPASVATEALGLHEDEYRALEAGRSTFVRGDAALIEAQAAFEREYHRRCAFWRAATGRPFPLPMRGR